MRCLMMVPFKTVAGVVAVAAVAAAPAFAAAPGEPLAGAEFPGGAATSRGQATAEKSFTNPSGNLPDDGMAAFKAGHDLFRQVWQSVPAADPATDGLGPLYNAPSCQRCHIRDGRGHPPEANFPDDDATSMFLRLSIPPESDAQAKALSAHRIKSVPEPTYGGQLQDFAIEGIAPEGKMHVSYESVPFTFPDGEEVVLRKPAYSIERLAYGPLHAKTMLSPRVANQMIGLGLLAAIPEKDILRLADPNDADGDGVSGKPNIVWSREAGEPMLGRFGWKAGNATVKQQAADAFEGDIGISNPLARRAEGDCTKAQPACFSVSGGSDPNLGGLEAGARVLHLVASYARNLAVPRRRGYGSARVIAGERIFHRAGCARCHHPAFTTGLSRTEPHLSHQKIWPYTDLLLHDMGEGLADYSREGEANGREWRTAPLWGIGLTQTVSGHTFFLHDGRARNLTEVILWHGGEAQAARDAFAALPGADRDRLIAFLNSL